MKIIFFIASRLFILSMFALPLHRAIADCQKIFPISTEFQIGKIKHMVEQAPPGVFISVGSERSFRGASMMPQLTHVYLLDISPDIIRFNKINIELLKATSRQNYCHLRWNASYEEWKEVSSSLTREDFEWWQDYVRDLEKMSYPLPEALNKFKGLPYAQKFLKIRQKLITFYQVWRSKVIPSYPEKQFLENIHYNQLKSIAKQMNIVLDISSEEWDWWERYGRNKEQECSKLWLEKSEEAVDLGQAVDFKTGNYLFNDKLYQKLHRLALNNQFTIKHINLGNSTELEKFLAQINKDKATISVLDLDNLYFIDYLGQETYNEVVRKFLPYGQDKSLLIVMSNYKDYACAQFQLYLGFTFENIRQWPQFFYMQSFIDTLPKGLLDLIDGRVYEKDEHPPYQYLLGC